MFLLGLHLFDEALGTNTFTLYRGNTKIYN